MLRSRVIASYAYLDCHFRTVRSKTSYSYGMPVRSELVHEVLLLYLVLSSALEC